jgi:NhaA family Na+:H+ antiporter
VYFDIWNYELALGIGSFRVSESLLHWVNDGLMAIFFFVVGLEIKREVMAGELSTIKDVVLPLTAAIGGMLVPAIIFLLVIGNTEMAKVGASLWLRTLPLVWEYLVFWGQKSP